MIFRFTFPVATRSPNGARQHPHAMARLMREARSAVLAMATIDLRGKMSQHLPRILVTYTRHSPKLMDDDNLRAAMKPVRDALCQALGLADDQGVLVEHRYLQAKANPLQPNVTVDVEVSCVTCTVAGRLTPSLELGDVATKLHVAEEALHALLHPEEKS